MSDGPDASSWRDRTTWSGGRGAPLRAFLRTESGSAGVLVGAVVVALVWANVDADSYEAVWSTRLSFELGPWRASYPLETWINSGLMTLFFLVVGLEARRELDLGELRDRARFLLPFAVGLAGMALPVGLYLLVNHGGPGAHGWGVAMSTDTALALGLLSVLGQGVPDRIRVFLLTVFVVDDLAALAVIALVYSVDVQVMPLAVALLLFLLVPAAMSLGLRQRSVYLAIGVAMWAALMASGVDPVVTGLAIGLTATAYTPSRGDLDRATGVVRQFREEPSSELARTASLSLAQTLSPNERLQTFYHPWTSYVIVPLFALANAGIPVDAAFLGRAYTSPITLGILLGYLLGKPVAVVVTTWLVSTLSRGRVRPSVGPAAVLGSGTLAGIGFTVTLLIASLAFEGDRLKEAKLGALSAALGASVLTWLVFRATALLPHERRARALLGDPQTILDLESDVDPRRDHVRGPAKASVTVVEYGDFECPHCGRAEPAVRDLLTDADIRYVWRHLPLEDVHPRALLAAEASEAAGAQDAFWEMHDVLLAHQEALTPRDLVGYADDLGLDTELFRDDLERHAHAARVAQDVESADVSGVSGTPTFFVNGQRHYGAYDLASLTEAVKIARVRAVIGTVPR